VSVNVLSNACVSLDRVKIPQDFIDTLEDFEKEPSHYGYLPV